MAADQSASNVKGLRPEVHDGKGLKIAIITARWNEKITGALTQVGVCWCGPARAVCG